MTTIDELVEALRLARKTAVDLALMAEPERRDEAFRRLAVAADEINQLVTDRKLRYRIACPSAAGGRMTKRGKQPP